MKILYLIHEFYPAHHGGSEKFILQLAQRVQAEGHQVKIVTYDKQNRQPLSTLSPAGVRPKKVAGFAHRRSVTGESPVAFQARLERCPQFGTHPPAARWYKRVKTIVAAALRRTGLLALWPKRATPKPEPIQIYEAVYAGVPVLGFRSPHLTAFAEALLQREAPDLIHAGYLLRNAEFIYAAQRLRIPYVITLTSFWLICPKHILVNEKRQVCAGPRSGAECLSACPTYSHERITKRYADMQRIFDQAGAVIAPSHYLAQIFQREISNLPLTYIPYGMDCQRLPVNRRVYPTDQPLVFFFGGRLDPEKGLDLLLTAFKRLASPQVRLQLYGDGKLRELVQQAVRVDSRISYGGVYTHNEVGTLLNQVDVVVIPSIWHENLPLIMQEAQAAGVPTLVSDVGGMTECVTDGLNGFTFRLSDVGDLQRKLQMIIDQPELLNGIKENMRNPKPGQYRVTSLEEEAAMYLEQYERILAKPQQVMG